MPQISVIVPIYKVEPYLCRCVDSILAQTFTDFECILVDDGSPDNCGQICDEYAAKDSRIHVIHKENGGLSSSRNAGIDYAVEQSDSQWLSFIDSDDWVHPCFLEYLHRAAVEQNVKISACNVYETKQIDKGPDDCNYAVELLDGIDFHMNNNIWATTAWNKLYVKELFDGYRYPIGRIHEDEFLTYKLLYNAKNIAWLEAQLYVYYHREDSITGKYSVRTLDRLDALKEQIEFFRKISKPIYIKKMKHLLFDYHWQLRELRVRNIHRDIYRNRRSEYREFISKNKKILDLNIWKTPAIYDEAYPHLMKVYWVARWPFSKVKYFLLDRSEKKQ